MEDKKGNIACIMEKDACHLQHMVNYVNYADSLFHGVQVANELGYINTNCQPVNMVGGGEHFVECLRIRENEEGEEEELTPMDLMYKKVLKKGY
jgi:hypothetical protein